MYYYVFFHCAFILTMKAYMLPLRRFEATSTGQMFEFITNITTHHSGVVLIEQINPSNI